jgi:protein-L-isoaspartate(D-aspartate) O-methyltransferase
VDKENDLAAVRRAYAKQILAAVNVRDTRLEQAFSAVRREDFLGPGPWQIFRLPGAYVPTPDSDPVYLYTDCLVAIAADKSINNGQPSLHAYLLGACAPKEGEHMVHVGTGAGYYTAIMAELVGPQGRVTGIEFDPELAERARAHLSHYSNVEIITGDGAVSPFAPAEVIYVNAGATQPARAWLEGLKPGGRLILPLTTDKGFGGAIDAGKIMQRGAVFRIERQAQDYLAKWISPVVIYPCAGNRDAQAEQRLARALETGNPRQVTRLIRDGAVPEDRIWLKGDGWALISG